jgi:hypothetical protein
MAKRTRIGKTPREHFKQAVDDELTKFVRKEIAFQEADRIERAARFRLPAGSHVPSHSPQPRHQKGPTSFR